MRKSIIYLLVSLLFASCEDVYNPQLDARENVIVADARIVADSESNYIKLTRTTNFNNQQAGYPAVTSARVTITDSEGTEYLLEQTAPGYYKVDFELNPELLYKIDIGYLGDTFESDFEPVPEVPKLDTVYGISELRVTQGGGVNSVDDFEKRPGAQMYTDITNADSTRFYRFTAKKIVQYTYVVEIVMMGEVMPETMYAWKTFIPQETFNIAAPPEYSATMDIIKHPLFFMEKEAYIQPDAHFAGWILILDQYSLSKSAYDFYNDLNSQLNADGKLFDPLYVQARNNLKCTTDPNKIILGNFEISAHNETRYFIRYISQEKGYFIKQIPYFYDIPTEGEQLTVPPEWWEYGSKTYP